MPPTTPEQVLLLGGIAALVVLVLVGLVVVSVRRHRRAVSPATEVDDAGPTSAPPAPREPEPTRTVADAVQRALAAREARSGDVRDRLLAALLDDPVRAVGATIELDACRRQLDRLTGAVEHERGVLGAVLARLGAAGLSDEQLARLAALPADEVRQLLGRSGVDGPGRDGLAGDALQAG